jgi:hypothetical protein
MKIKNPSHTHTRSLILEMVEKLIASFHPSQSSLITLLPLWKIESFFKALTAVRRAEKRETHSLHFIIIIIVVIQLRTKSLTPTPTRLIFHHLTHFNLISNVGR